MNKKCIQKFYTIFALIFILEFVIFSPVKSFAADVPTSPVITATCNGITVESCSTQNGNVTINIGGSTSPSGIKEYDYYINKDGTDGSLQAYISPVTISDEGSYTVYARAVSNDGIDDKICNFNNISFNIIKNAPKLSIKNNFNLNWTTPDTPQNYTYTVFRSGSSNDYNEGSNIISQEDSCFTDGKISSDWNKGCIGTGVFGIENDSTKNYMKITNTNTSQEGCSTLLVDNIKPNSMYKLKIEYNYPYEPCTTSPLCGRNFGIVNKADTFDVCNIELPNDFAKTNGWQTFNYDFNSSNNTSLRIRAYVDGTSQEADITNVQLIPLYPKSLEQTSGNSYTDTTAVDKTAPEAISSITAKTDNNFNTNINITQPEDNGTDYTYYVEAVGTDGLKRDSNKVTATITSGVKGYYYIIDQNRNNYDFDTSDAQYTTDGDNINYTAATAGTYYLHSKTIDNAGNTSMASAVKFNVDTVIKINSITPETIDFGHLNPLASENSKKLLANISGNSSYNISADSDSKDVLMKVSTDSAYVNVGSTDTVVKSDMPAGQNINVSLDVLFNSDDWSLSPRNCNVPVNINVKSN